MMSAVIDTVHGQRLPSEFTFLNVGGLQVFTPIGPSGAIRSVAQAFLFDGPISISPYDDLGGEGLHELRGMQWYTIEWNTREMFGCGYAEIVAMIEEKLGIAVKRLIESRSANV